MWDSIRTGKMIALKFWRAMQLSGAQSVTEPHIMMVIFNAKPGHEGTVRSLLSAMVRATRIEQGCERYVLHQSIDSDRVFAFYETWTSKRDWEVHMETAHLKNLLVELPQYLAEEIRVVNLREMPIN
jgi:quinol monooxygenase YgiN